MAYPFVQAKWYTPDAIVDVRALVVHMAEGGGTVGYLRNPPRDVSAHYVVEYSGRIVQMVRDGDASHSLHTSPEPYRTASYGIYSPDIARAVLGDGWADPNRYLHAVEVEGFRAAGPNVAQIASLVELVADLRARFPLRGLLGHRDIQDKPCPGGLIPWPALGGHGPFMTITVVKREQWTPTVTNGQSNGVLRATSDRAAPVSSRVPIGSSIVTIAEVKTGPGGAKSNDDWRLVDVTGAPLYALRSDWVSQGAPVIPAPDCSAAVKAATDPLEARITEVIAARDAEAAARATLNDMRRGAVIALRGDPRWDI